jgi:hypothetical protein
MPHLIKIPAASVEYQARFARPCIGFIGTDRPRAAEAIVDALLPFNFQLANSESASLGNLAAHKVSFKLPERGISLYFSAEEYRFSKDGANWETAEEDGQVLVAAERALLDGSTARVALCTVNLGMHLQLLTTPREEVLAPFVPEPFRHFLVERKANTYGNHLKWATGDLLLDFSLLFANSIFVRFSAQFDGHPPVSEIMAAVRREQHTIFQILDVRERIDG